MILDAKITIYNSVKDNTGHAGTFADFLRLCRANIEGIKRLRETTNEDERRAIKSTLPAATLSGVFAPTRAVANLQEHSGYICADIDHVPDCAELMNKLADMENVAYCSRSVSGDGVFAVVPIAYPDKHVQHFEALRRLFADMGITLDAQCKDITRLRIVSYDPDARLRLDAVPFVGLWDEPRQADRYEYRHRHYTEDRTLEHVAECCRQIVSGHIDITDGYENWRNAALSLASLGETGRDFFHAVSSQHPKYNRADSDRKFSQCLNVGSMGVGTFFQMCADAGVTFKKS